MLALERNFDLPGQSSRSGVFVGFMGNLAGFTALLPVRLPQLKTGDILIV